MFFCLFVFIIQFHLGTECVLSQPGQAEGVCKVFKPAAWAAGERKALFWFCIPLTICEAGAAAGLPSGGGEETISAVIFLLG